MGDGRNRSCTCLMMVVFVPIFALTSSPKTDHLAPGQAGMDAEKVDLAMFHGPWP